MIDNEDADFVLLWGIATPGWLGLIVVAIAFVLFVIAASNSEDCAERKCERGKPKVVENECVCVEAAR